MQPSSTPDWPSPEESRAIMHRLYGRRAAVERALWRLYWRVHDRIAGER